jgi:anti-anti-sigma regulatory factor
MSNKPVMSHDPRAGEGDEIVGDMPALPEGAVAAASADANDIQIANVLVLPDSLGIADVGDFHAQLASRLVETGAVSIDGSAVENIDGAGVQLLAAFIKDMVSKSSVITWIGASEALRRAATRLGVCGALQLDQDS